MHFDWTITFGAIVVVLGFVGTTVWSTGKIVSKVTLAVSQIHNRLDAHDKWITGHEECNQRILKYMEDNSTKLSTLSSDVAYLRGRAEERHENGPSLKERY